MSNYQDSLFSDEEITGQTNLFSDTEEDYNQKANEPVTCLGMTFANDDERRIYFREELRKKLPELRHIEGFPIGSDDDIINLSDPPYYTACPNPWLNDFVKEWEEEKKQLEAEGKRSADFEVTEPYAADISDIKNDSVYRAHTYHTKVPHTIIMRYLLHYTQPGDIVFDGFAGTGMTGLACQSCESPTDNVMTKLSFSEDFSKVRLGKRNCICGDLSPYASLIAYNYNTPIDSKLLSSEVKRILKEMYDEFGWMFTTRIKNIGDCEIKCVVWSDVCVCSNCGEKHVLWEYTVDKKNKSFSGTFKCPNCNSIVNAKDADKAYETVYDSINNNAIIKPLSEPVLVVCVDKKGNRYEVKPNEFDFEVIKKIKDINITTFIPTETLPHGFNLDQPQRSHAIKYFYQFYTKRNLIILSNFLEKINQSALPSKIKFIFTGMINRSTKMNRVHFTKYLNGGTDWDAGHLKGTLYVPSYQVESSAIAQIGNKLTRYLKAVPMLPQEYSSVIQVSSACHTKISDSSIDYIFTDPPFGGNIMYSELNLLPESWLRVKTNNREEAIINEVQEKELIQYYNLMSASWKEFFRILKPGKWMTVEFSNTSASVWNSIQNSLVNAGFIIANVAALNKGQGGIRSITTTTAVKQDLAITCYKPSDELTEKFKTSEDLAMNVWDFVEELLCHLPVHLQKGNKTTAVVERSPKILFDRIISYYVQHGYPVPMNAADFQRGLRERFVERDGMFFTAEQSLEYDTKRAQTESYEAAQSMFVGSEAEGIEWLKRELVEPKTYQDLQPEWMQALVQTKKGDNLPELKQILEENFLKDDEGRWYKPDPEKEADLEKVRARELARNFKAYVEMASTPKGKIKEARLEALRYGFRECYKEKDFATIVKVAQRLPEALVMEDDVLLQFYDIAINRV